MKHVRGVVSQGFTMLEMVVVLALFSFLLLFSFPQILGMLNRMKIEGTVRETAILLRAVRLEAIKRNCFGVVQIDPAARRIVAFADLDRNGSFDSAGAVPDILIGRIDLPTQVFFQDEAGTTGLASVKGLVNPDVPVVLADQQVIYREDGSLLSTGALRFADSRGNVLEVNLPSQATGKVETRKYNGTAYVTPGDGAAAWKFQ